MKFTPTKTETAFIVKAEGRLDALTADLFANAIRSYIKEGNKDIRIDASEISYISSAGLRALLLCYRETSAASGSFAVITPSEIVRSVLEMSGMQLLLAK